MTILNCTESGTWILFSGHTTVQNEIRILLLKRRERDIVNSQFVSHPLCYMWDFVGNFMQSLKIMKSTMPINLEYALRGFLQRSLGEKTKIDRNDKI